MTELAMGPVDYIVIEWADGQPTGEAAPLLLDLVDRGLVRILDLVFITKADDGSIAAIELGDLPDAFAEFDGASSGLFSDEDLEEAASVLEPGTSAALLVWENRWAAPFAARAAELRRPARRQRAHPDRGPRGSARRRRRPRLTTPTATPKGHDMPGLLRMATRTAVVAGTATAVWAACSAARATSGPSRTRSSTRSRPRPQQYAPAPVEAAPAAPTRSSS